MCFFGSLGAISDRMPGELLYIRCFTQNVASLRLYLTKRPTFRGVSDSISGSAKPTCPPNNMIDNHTTTCFMIPSSQVLLSVSPLHAGAFKLTREGCRLPGPSTSLAMTTLLTLGRDLRLPTYIWLAFLRKRDINNRKYTHRLRIHCWLSRYKSTRHPYRPDIHNPCH